MKLACRYTLYIVLLLAGPALGDDTSLIDLTNYREYSPLLSSSGQPTAEQLEVVRDAGFERVAFRPTATAASGSS